jgi:transposase
LIGLLEEMKKINLEETYIDATFVRSKAGKQLVGNTKCGKGHKLMAICDDKSRPLALLLANASRSEIKLVFDTLGCLATRQKPKRIIGDKAYDSDKHDAELKQQGIDLIAPNKSNRKQNFQDKRPLRRYKRRHKIENFFAHIHNYRRTIISYDKYPHTFFGFVLFASILLILNKIK